MIMFNEFEIFMVVLGVALALFIAGVYIAEWIIWRRNKNDK